MARLICSDLSISNANASFSVQLRSPITIIGGDGATGKTLFYNMHKLEKLRRKKSSNIVCFNYETEGTFFDNLKQFSNKVILVDNADIIVPRSNKVKSVLSSSDCQFIFLGRDIERYGDWNNFAVLNEVKSNCFVLCYLFEKEGNIWA